MYILKHTKSQRVLRCLKKKYKSDCICVCLLLEVSTKCHHQVNTNKIQLKKQKNTNNYIIKIYLKSFIFLLI